MSLILTQGWIKLHRSIQESAVFDDGEPYTRRDAWIWILMNANMKDNVTYYGFNRIDIKRGQLITSVRSLSAAWNRSFTWCMKTVDLFCANGMLEKVRTPGGTLLTVVNYGFYQDTDAEARTLGGTDRERSVEQIANAPWNISKKDKKDKESKKDKNTSLISPSKGFDQFWGAYPRHEGKAAAEKAFAKLAPDEGLLERMIIAIGEQKQSRQWNENGGQFVPYPATWLNQKRWEDEPPKPQETYRKPRKDDYEQRPNNENDMDAIPDWLIKYREEHPEGVSV